LPGVFSVDQHDGRAEREQAMGDAGPDETPADDDYLGHDRLAAGRGGERAPGGM
jgi:hypothetical protein